MSDGKFDMRFLLGGGDEFGGQWGLLGGDDRETEWDFAGWWGSR